MDQINHSSCLSVVNHPALYVLNVVLYIIVHYNYSTWVDCRRDEQRDPLDNDYLKLREHVE